MLLVQQIRYKNLQQSIHFLKTAFNLLYYGRDRMKSKKIYLKKTFKLNWMMEKLPFEINMLILKLGMLRMNVPVAWYIHFIF